MRESNVFVNNVQSYQMIGEELENQQRLEIKSENYSQNYNYYVKTRYKLNNDDIMFKELMKLLLFFVQLLIEKFQNHM